MPSLLDGLGAGGGRVNEWSLSIKRDTSQTKAFNTWTVTIS